MNSENREKSNLRIPISDNERYQGLKVMKLDDTYNDKDWISERGWALEMMSKISGLQEAFTLDFITKGDGNCYMTAFLQQMRRPEILDTLPRQHQIFIKHFDQGALRRKMRTFCKENQHGLILYWKREIFNFTGRTFDEYWSRQYMLKHGTWADEFFIRLTACFFNVDINIHQNALPNIERISGNMDNQNEASPREIHLGYLVGLHYQSILPKERQGNQVFQEIMNQSFLLCN